MNQELADAAAYAPGRRCAQMAALWNDVIAASLNVCRRNKNRSPLKTASIDAYLLQKQLCPISSRSHSKRRSHELFWSGRPDNKNKTSSDMRSVPDLTIAANALQTNPPNCNLLAYNISAAWLIIAETWKWRSWDLSSVYGKKRATCHYRGSWPVTLLQRLRGGEDAARSIKRMKD